MARCPTDDPRCGRGVDATRPLFHKPRLIHARGLELIRTPEQVATLELLAHATLSSGDIASSIPLFREVAARRGMIYDPLPHARVALDYAIARRGNHYALFPFRSDRGPSGVR